jgi:hypothetical protein
MDHQESLDCWTQRVAQWRRRLSDLGLDGLLVALAPIARPLGPLAAQVLWMAQPTLRLVGGAVSEETGMLASILDDPITLERLLSQPAPGEVE